MGVFISVPKTVECVIGAVLFSAVFSLLYLRPLGILQAFGYSGRKMFGWAAKKSNAYFMRQTLLFMLCAPAYSVISLCLSFAGQWSAVAGLTAYVLFFGLYAYADKRLALRTTARFTPRLIRLYVITFFVTSVFAYLAFTLLNFADYLYGNHVFTILRYLPLALFPFLALPTLALGNLLDKIYEVPHNRRFVKSASAKLSASDIKKIGITGSYGKTSIKNILAQMLKQKFRVLATPSSHNTPMGLALTIDGANLSSYDVLIAEMGARRVGDIAELCTICPPDYAVITGVCPQHLQTFGDEDSVVAAKSEILFSTSDTAVIAADCYDKFAALGSCKKVCADCVSEISADCGGTSFTLTLDGRTARVRTKLLGAHSAENIGVAACLAHIMGLTLEEIASAAEKLDFVEHRLQLIEKDGVSIIDDGYNSNPKGAADALEVLKTFGGRKIVVTPGLVELGTLEESKNYELGKQLVGFDAVILVGDTLVTPVKRGYLEGGGDGQKISVCPTLFAAEEELKGKLGRGDAVLFLNDLPDIY